MCTSGAGFGEHCFDVSGDVFDWVLCCFSGTTYDVITYDVITFLICMGQGREYLWDEGGCSGRENAILLGFEGCFGYAAIIFYFMGTLTESNFIFAEVF